MGRWTDKPFISQGEWSNAHGDDGGLSFGGKNSGVQSARETTQGLPLDCCALSLRPFKQPVCTRDGYVFEEANIMSYIKEHHKHPFTDLPLEAKDLVAPLHYHTNASGQHVDPVSFKPLTRFTKIVANSKSGHVYLWSTVDEFNAKPKAWVDLVTGEPFSDLDLVVIHDPDAPPKSSTLVKKAPSLQQITKAAAPTPRADGQQYNAASYSKGLAAAAFTSTSMAPVTRNESGLIDSEEYMFSRIKDKGYARLSTNLGDLNLELFCHKAPRACYNFIKLSRAGYYKATNFHRSIKNFMIQGGDPTGTGRGGKSFWGSVFKDDEAKGKRPSHSERGVLSMANRGPNTNGSQFFILYRAAKHLDGKHTIFGRVVGGLDVLGKMEAVPTDDADKPAKDIIIQDVSILVDPFNEFSKRLERKIEHDKSSADLAAGKRKRTAEEEEELKRETTTWFGTTATSARISKVGTDGNDPPNQGQKGVGKYLKKPRFEASGPNSTPEGDSEHHKSKRRVAGYRFGDFNNW
ncbi:cyclophilin peptidyl-prolyl cis-trans isomerase Cyp8 [Coemansia sp. IMI 209127]|nr:cyclophilin peptidyl-prolyl cis-trans isomerase Cyp8 [Coemansia sp. IMI 209127]